jgi:hypothetical protein
MLGLIGEVALRERRSEPGEMPPIVREEVRWHS